MLRHVALVLCLTGLLAFSACDEPDGEQPVFITANGPGEVLVDVDVPDDGTSIRVDFVLTADDWEEKANWRITVYASYPDEPVAFVERRDTGDAFVAEAWATRSVPYTGEVAVAQAQDGSGWFRTGRGDFQVGTSLTGFDQWSALIAKDRPGAEDDSEPKEQPATVLFSGSGEVMSPSLEIPEYDRSIRVEFLDIQPDWEERANWRITVYAAESHQPVAYVERRVAAGAVTTETWTTRGVPGRALPAQADASESAAAFRPGRSGSFLVGISVTGFDQWSANVFLPLPRPVSL